MKRKHSQEEVYLHMHGRIYYNPEDSNIFVKRRGLCSWTMNFGNKWSWVITGAEGLLIVSLMYCLYRF